MRVGVTQTAKKKYVPSFVNGSSRSRASPITIVSTCISYITSIWSTFYCMEPHKKTSNIGKKVTTILEGIFLWAVCFWVYVLMTFLGRQTLNSGSRFALSSLRHESYRKEQSDLERSLMGKLLPTLFFLFLVVGAYL